MFCYHFAINNEIMKYAREMKVGALSIVCIFLLYFGFYYLKGVNIFSSVRSYHGQYEQVNGLQEQAAVYIKGFKVGQVDHIRYDFTKDTAFIVDISVKKDIQIPQGTTMALVADGLLGGTAIQLNIPTGAIAQVYEQDAFLPTVVVPGLMDNLENNVAGSVGTLVQHADSLILTIHAQLANNHLYNTLNNVEQVSSDLTKVSNDLKGIVKNQIPGLVEKVDTTMTGLSEVVEEVRAADLPAIFASVDTSVNAVKKALTDETGTVGKLMYSSELYNHIDAAVVSVDSLVTDLKAHPKRYVQISVFGKKEK